MEQSVTSPKDRYSNHNRLGYLYPPYSEEQSGTSRPEESSVISIEIDARNNSISNEYKKEKRRAQIAKAARKHRLRQKEELARLRSMVANMEQEILHLRQSLPNEHVAESIWRCTAEGHTAIRSRIDQENEFLRKALLEQLRFTQQLQQLCIQQPVNLLKNDIENNELPVLIKQKCLSKLTTTVGDSMEATTLRFARAQELFAQGDRESDGLNLRFEYSDRKGHIVVYAEKCIPNISQEHLAEVFWSTFFDNDFYCQLPYVRSFELLDIVEENIICYSIVHSMDNMCTVTLQSVEAAMRKIMKDKTIFSICPMTDCNNTTSTGYINNNSCAMIRNVGDGCQLIWCIDVQVVPNSYNVENSKILETVKQKVSQSILHLVDSVIAKAVQQEFLLEPSIIA